MRAPLMLRTANLDEDAPYLAKPRSCILYMHRAGAGSGRVGRRGVRSRGARALVGSLRMPCSDRRSRWLIAVPVYRHAPAPGTSIAL